LHKLLERVVERKVKYFADDGSQKAEKVIEIVRNRIQSVKHALLHDIVAAAKLAYPQVVALFVRQGFVWGKVLSNNNQTATRSATRSAYQSSPQSLLLPTSTYLYLPLPTYPYNAHAHGVSECMLAKKALILISNQCYHFLF
jgi:hypothetical protein